MHILYTFPYFIIPGGAATFVLSSANRLAKRGNQVTILTQKVTEDIKCKYEDIEFCQIGGSLPNELRYWLNSPLLLRKVNQKIKLLSPDVVFPQIFPDNYWAFTFKVFNKNQKCIWYCHEPSAFIHDFRVIEGLHGYMLPLAKMARFPMIKIDKMLVHKVDDLLVNSKFTAKNVREIYGLDSKLVYTGIDDDIYPITPARKEKYFISVGHMTKFKNFELIMRAFAKSSSENKSELLLVGDRPSVIH